MHGRLTGIPERLREVRREKRADRGRKRGLHRKGTEGRESTFFPDTTVHRSPINFCFQDQPARFDSSFTKVNCSNILQIITDHFRLWHIKTSLIKLALFNLPTVMLLIKRCTLKHLNFEKSYGLQFPLLSDIGANVADAYGSKLEIPFMGKFANRLTFIIGSDGKIEKVRP